MRIKINGLKKWQELGASRLGVLFFCSIVGAIGYAAWQIFPFYYNYYEIVGVMEAQAAKANFFTDEEIRQTVMDKIKALQIPIEEESDLRISRFDGKIVIEFSYEEILYVDFGKKSYDLHVFNFHPYTERYITGPERKRRK